jgi:hypothetical protein
MTMWRKSSYSGPGTDFVEVSACPWRKSSYSAAETDCVEVSALPWRKSSHSGSDTDCVEGGHAPGAVLIRDTKDHGAGPVLRVTPAGWAAFTASVKR